MLAARRPAHPVPAKPVAAAKPAPPPPPPALPPPQPGRSLPAVLPAVQATHQPPKKMEPYQQPPLRLFENRVEKLHAGNGAAPMSEALEWVRDDLTRRKPELAEVFLFSDFQKYTWLRQGSHAIQSARVLGDLCGLCELYLVDVGGRAQFNYIATMLRPAEYVMSAGATVTLGRLPVNLLSFGESTSIFSSAAALIRVKPV